jgi:hypothetical protein
MKPHRIKGAIIGCKLGCNKFYVRLLETCPLGAKGEVVVVSKAVKTPCGNLEIEE